VGREHIHKHSSPPEKKKKKRIKDIPDHITAQEAHRDGREEIILNDPLKKGYPVMREKSRKISAR